MQLETQSPSSAWDGTVPVALDWRIIGLVVALAAVAASLNVPTGGVIFAAVAFVGLVSFGLVIHVAGERRLRRVATGLASHWRADGVGVDGVTRSSGFRGTAWTVHTSAGPVTIRGLALAPLSRVVIESDGIGDTMDARTALGRLDGLAGEWSRFPRSRSPLARAEPGRDP